MIEVRIAVEGKVDRAVAERLVQLVGGTPGPVYGQQGKDYIRKQLGAWNAAAQRSPWLVLVDLNSDEGCAPLLVRSWLRNRAPYLCFRVAVREVEAWLLADREGMAEFLGVAEDELPEEPEAVSDPKKLVVELARRSRRRWVREELVPDSRSGRKEGRAYASRLAEFARGGWRPEVAAGRSPSLRRAVQCLKRLVDKVGAGRSIG